MSASSKARRAAIHRESIRAAGGRMVEPGRLWDRFDHKPKSIGTIPIGKVIRLPDGTEQYTIVDKPIFTSGTSKIPDSMVSKTEKTQWVQARAAVRQGYRRRAKLTHSTASHFDKALSRLNNRLGI